MSLDGVPFAVRLSFTVAPLNFFIGHFFGSFGE